ncbi:MAG: uroporphyrinogen decarboxylase [Actinobacteria bacterium]|nr:uroporphyrinogen decarboxylase [Actinomycetota bacterium]
MPPAGAASPFIAACRGQPASRVPVWFMRQAGRSLPEYRAVRERHSFAEVVADPELAAEVTLQPVRRLGVDAAILFSDIVTPVQAIVDGIHIEAERGPVVVAPFRTKADLARLRPLEPELDVPYVLDTVRLVRSRLPAGVPLIGFAGAPFTVASYLVEGGRSRDHRRTKALMYGEPDVWADLVDRLAGVALASLRAQVEAGAQAVQLFDSWVGTLSEADYRRYVLPASARVLDGLADLDVPRIHFGVGAGHLLSAMADAGADVVGVDWRISLDEARRRLGAGVAVQGNLDPAALFCPPAVLAARVRAVLAANGGRPGHVFNLGWGVLPDTDPAALRTVVEIVHGHGQGSGGAEQPPSG